MSLRKRSVVSPDTIVEEVNGDADVQTRRLGKRDCYFSGPTEGTADVDDSDQYKRYANDSADSYDDDDDSDDDSGEDGMEGLWDDEVEIPEAEQDEDDRRSVSSRSVADRKAVVEVINYLDHWYLQKVENNLGLTTTDELIDLQVMKWSGAQAILGDADRVTWDIKIKLFKIEIWRTDPSWYVTNPNNTIGGRLAKICQGTKDRTDADQVTLSTASTSDGGRIGLSYIGTVCKPRWRCAAVITANLKHGTELHEFGHRPRYGTHCVGDEYKAELCSSQACSGESSIESDLVEQRADKICNHMKSNAATNDGYSGEGQVVGTAGVTEKRRFKSQKSF
nr:hypothetical protein BaRGS_010089 [Batillaria attramentaria]